MKLGLYHSVNNVADGEVEYKNIEIEGPAGIIRTTADDRGAIYRGCFTDKKRDRVLTTSFISDEMTNDVSPCFSQSVEGSKSLAVGTVCSSERSLSHDAPSMNEDRDEARPTKTLPQRLTHSPRHRPTRGLRSTAVLRILRQRPLLCDAVWPGGEHGYT